MSVSTLQNLVVKSLLEQIDKEKKNKTKKNPTLHAIAESDTRNHIMSILSEGIRTERPTGYKRNYLSTKGSKTTKSATKDAKIMKEYVVPANTYPVYNETMPTGIIRHPQKERVNYEHFYRRTGEVGKMKTTDGPGIIYFIPLNIRERPVPISAFIIGGNNYANNKGEKLKGYYTGQHKNGYIPRTTSQTLHSTTAASLSKPPARKRKFNGVPG